MTNNFKKLHLILKNFHPPGNSVHDNLTTLTGKTHSAVKDRNRQSPVHLAPHPSPPKAKKQKSALTQKQLETSLDHLVASTLVHGQQTSGVLRSMFGLLPSLIGR
jgi:hypothetical protein